MEMSMPILTFIIAYLFAVFLLFSHCNSFHRRMRFNADEQRPLLKHAIFLTITLESWDAWLQSIPMRIDCGLFERCFSAVSLPSQSPRPGGAPSIPQVPPRYPLSGSRVTGMALERKLSKGDQGA
jgi:hypothetical protein